MEKNIIKQTEKPSKAESIESFSWSHGEENDSIVLKWAKMQNQLLNIYFSVILRGDMRLSPPQLC